MAIKGSKFNKYSDEFKLMVVEEYLTGTIGYERLAKNIIWLLLGQLGSG